MIKMSRSKREVQIRSNRAEHVRSDHSWEVSISEWRKQIWGRLEEKIRAEGSEQVKKTRRNRVEQEDWICEEWKGWYRDIISEQDEWSGFRRVERIDQYRTIKVKRSKQIRADKSESYRMWRIRPRLQMRPRAAGMMSRRKKEAEAETEADEKEWVGGSMMRRRGIYWGWGLSGGSSCGSSRDGRWGRGSTIGRQ